MGRFSYEDAEKYGSSGSGGSYFKLSNDGDVARVQLLGNDMEDFPGYAVHKVADGKYDNGDKRYKWVNCLREYNDPVEVCPFCKAKIKQEARLFLPLYNIDAGEVQIWERGKTFFRTLASYCARNPEVVSIVTEIERQGKAGDTSTTYQLYPTKDEPERERLEDFEDDMPEIIGRYILDKSADEMEYYLENKHFPSDDSEDEEEPPRRRSSRREEDDDKSESRRRPSRRRRDDEEEF